MKIKSIYEHYPLYQLIYGRSDAFKHQEARGIDKMISVYQRETGVSALDICELLAGRSEHRKWMNLNGTQRYAIDNYYCVDREGPEDVVGRSEEFIKGDVFELSLEDFPVAPNLFLANFFSISSITDKNGNHDCLDELFKSVYSMLNKGGAFAFDFALNGYTSALCATRAMSDDEDEVKVLEVDHDALLRTYLKIAPWTKCTVEYTCRSWYDRVTATNYDKFGPILVKVNDIVTERVVVQDAFTQRYWTESEILGAAFRGGREWAPHFFRFDYNEEEFSDLQRVITQDDEIDEDDDAAPFFSTNILLIKQ